jgi:predicted outer membrane protein
MGPGVEPRAGQTPDAKAERDELAHLIADLDDAYAEGLVNEQAYEQLRARMKKRLLNIWSE